MKLYERGFPAAKGEQERGVRLFREVRTESPSYPLSPLILGQLAARQQQWSVARPSFAAAAKLPIPEIKCAVLKLLLNQLRYQFRIVGFFHVFQLIGRDV